MLMDRRIHCFKEASSCHCVTLWLLEERRHWERALENICAWECQKTILKRCRGYSVSSTRGECCGKNTDEKSRTANIAWNYRSCMKAGRVGPWNVPKEANSWEENNVKGGTTEMLTDLYELKKFDRNLPHTSKCNCQHCHFVALPWLNWFF